MMGFFEGSRAKGAPIQLYLFRYGPGPGHVLGITDAEQPVIFDDLSYLPEPIRRDRIVANGTLDRSTLEVTTVRTSPVADFFRAFPPSHPIGLTIYSGHFDDPDVDYQAIWRGRVLGCAWEDDMAMLSCEPVSSQRRRTTLRTNYQYGCPLALYQQGPGMCNASKEDATHEATVAAVDGALVTLPAGWVDTALLPRFDNGLLEWSTADGQTESRTILRVTDDRVLLLSGVPASLRLGQTVFAIYGCSHDMEGCRLHRNIVNFGGCPDIPQINPIGRMNIFY